MTSSSAHLETVRAIYQAFGRGDVASIVDRLADDVRWEHWADSFAQRAGVEWFSPRVGPDDAAGFFEIVGAFDVTEFAVLDLLASEHQVAVEVVIEASTPGGGRYRDEELHLWTFAPDGRVCRLRHYADTAKQIAAAEGKDTTAS